MSAVWPGVAVLGDVPIQSRNPGHYGQCHPWCHPV